MTSINKEIFKAIHENKWLYIEYKNKSEQITKYWIGVKSINVQKRTMVVRGLHTGEFSLANLTIRIDGILSASVLDGTLFQESKSLAQDIYKNPDKYLGLFDNIPNLKILNYLSECNKLDTTPYKCEYALIQRLDGQKLDGGSFHLDDEQFAEVVKSFQYRTKNASSKNKFKQLALNVMSVNAKRGLYVLAYRKLFLDVDSHSLKQDSNITLCREFTIEGEKHSIRQFLDADDQTLLDDFENNLEQIKDVITQTNPSISGIDDMPYIIAIGMEVPLLLDDEYSAIVEMYENDTVSTPIKAFFGEHLKRPVRRKNYPITLIDNHINLDQLLAINSAMRYPLTYVQGPPGTGKTSTILNTILTAFFNERTVLFASYNNTPIDGVFNKLKSIKYKGKSIPFPIIRLGNNEKVEDALNYILSLYETARALTIYDSTLDKNHNEKVERANKLTELLKTYEELLDLNERKEIIDQMMKGNQLLNLQLYQLRDIEKRIAEIGEITDEDALKLLTNDSEEFGKYLYYTSAKYIKRLDEPKYKELLGILKMGRDNPERIKAFNHYLSNEDNVRNFVRIFPIVLTTCISAHKIGTPQQYFDMVIMDEASQCNTAMSLVPILRGESLMLVGDPQQLNPVILLSQSDNDYLRRKYKVSSEYDYISNSVYKTYLACDSVSDEILLSNHYRCAEKIIQFNNKKYYNSKLKIKSKVASEHPLTLVDVQDSKAAEKNTAPGEADQIVKFIQSHPGKSIGIVTPFVNQKKLISNRLTEEGLLGIPVGTVHAFQGDEKDIVLFSLGLNDTTHQKTYDWLKNNKELINVATSRARERLVFLCSKKNLSRLHSTGEDDDIYELAEYIESNGKSVITQRTAMSRALGIKPYSTETESAFWTSLNHALSNIGSTSNKYIVRKEVPISQVFEENTTYSSLFYNGRFDFVLFDKVSSKVELPVLAIELDGMEHYDNDVVAARDKQKESICQAHGFELIRVKNTYARRYHYIKDVLEKYFNI